MAICEKNQKPLSWWNELDIDDQEELIAWHQYRKERRKEYLSDIPKQFTKKINPYSAIVQTLLMIANVSD